VPGLKNNLLSVGQLQERGLAVLMQSNECRIYHHTKGLVFQTNMTANRMFVLLSSTQSIKKINKEECFQVTAEDVAHLWHRRFGHLSYKGLKTLQTKGMVRGLPSFSESGIVCTNCLKGKQHRDVISRRSTWRASEKLELVHADICGPISPFSEGNKRYFICFIDDYSRKAWVYFLSYKSDAFTTFKLFKALVEKETDLSIKCLRTDRGGEFTSNEFKEYCKMNGIKRQLTAAYTPQQNGVAERKNRTVMNMVRSLLVEKNVPRKFWAEAVNWAFYVLNRCPTSSVKEMTPVEAWCGVKPSVGHLRVFGCIAYAHVPDARRTKLEDKSRCCVLFGISEESKAYRLYDPTSKRIIISRDVVFEEDGQWNWEKRSEEDNTFDTKWEDEKSEEREEFSDINEEENAVEGNEEENETLDTYLDLVYGSNDKEIVSDDEYIPSGGIRQHWQYFHRQFQYQRRGNTQNRVQGRGKGRRRGGISVSRPVEPNLDDINTVEYLQPVNTEGLLQKVRAAIFLSLDELWPIPSNIMLIATFLDPRFKNFDWCNGNGKDEAKKLVQELYNDAKKDFLSRNSIIVLLAF
jgi:hypothetical protein